MKRPPLPTIPCDACNDQREVPGPGAGACLKREREERDVARNELAEHFGFSISYTVDLEHGTRPLTWALVERYREAIESAVQARLDVKV